MSLKKGTIIRLIRDSVGDLPKYLIGRKGKVISENKLHNEYGFKSYNVMFPMLKNTRVLWEDEITVLSYRKP